MCDDCREQGVPATPLVRAIWGGIGLAAAGFGGWAYYDTEWGQYDGVAKSVHAVADLACEREAKGAHFETPAADQPRMTVACLDGRSVELTQPAFENLYGQVGLHPRSYARDVYTVPDAFADFGGLAGGVPRHTTQVRIEVGHSSPKAAAAPVSEKPVASIPLTSRRAGMAI